MITLYGARKWIQARATKFMSDYDKQNKRNQRQVVVNRYVNFVLLVIKEKLDS